MIKRRLTSSEAAVTQSLSHIHFRGRSFPVLALEPDAPFERRVVHYHSQFDERPRALIPTPPGGCAARTCRWRFPRIRRASSSGFLDGERHEPVQDIQSPHIRASRARAPSNPLGARAEVDLQFQSYRRSPQGSAGCRSETLSMFALSSGSSTRCRVRLMRRLRPGRMVRRPA